MQNFKLVYCIIKVSKSTKVNKMFVVDANGPKAIATSQNHNISSSQKAKKCPVVTVAMAQRGEKKECQNQCHRDQMNVD